MCFNFEVEVTMQNVSALPSPPTLPAPPLLGHAVQFLKDPLALLAKLHIY